MIRGPVLPQVRERLWSLVATRLERIETGLKLVMEGLDCSDGQLGLVEGLARDAMGGPVLVLLANDGDALLPARVLAAGAFLQRVGDAFVRAVPEAGYRMGAAARVLVVGSDAARAALEQVSVLPVAGLEVCVLEPFRVAGSERFAVRHLPCAGGNVQPRSEQDAAGLPEFVVPSVVAPLWATLESICERIDMGVQLTGDRFSRLITWNGALLGEVRSFDSGLVGTAATGVAIELRDVRDVRRFGDQLLRAYARRAGLVGPQDGNDACKEGDETDVRASVKESMSPVAAEAVDRRNAATRHAVLGREVPPVGESLRSSLEAARLSSEEYSALGAPASSAEAGTEGPLVAEDRQQAPSARRTAPQVGRDD